MFLSSDPVDMKSLTCFGLHGMAITLISFLATVNIVCRQRAAFCQSATEAVAVPFQLLQYNGGPSAAAL